MKLTRNKYKELKKKKIASSKSLLSSYSYASDVTHGPFKSQSQSMPK